MVRKLIGVIGGGNMGHDPWDPRTWSGISYFLLSELRRRGMLYKAIGVEAAPITRCLRALVNFHFSYQLWRRRYYMDILYREALTRRLARLITTDDLSHDFLQLGGMLNVARIVDGRSRVISYHDGNLVQYLQSPYASRKLKKRQIDAALAYEREVYSGIDRIMTTSDYLRDSFIHDFKISRERVVRVGAGINLHDVPHEIPERHWDARQILFIGVEFARKGGWQLLRAFKAVRNRYPDATLHIVGPRQLAVPPELSSGVQHHGYLDKNDPIGAATWQRLMRDSCLFVMPSLYEPFGIAPLEAMAHQIPAVVTNRWALREIVTPGVDGDHVECGNVDHLVAVLGKLLAAPADLKRLGENGRRKVLEWYTWPRVVERMRQVWAEVDQSAIQ
jgi:glycosyltransferase involved in cell wall biosynthesis